MVRYDSDGSTLVSDDYRDRRRKHWSPSEDAYSRRRSYHSTSSRGDKKSGSKYETLGKAAIVVAILQVVSGIYQMWHDDRNAQKDRKYRRRRRKEFEKAKKARRKDEERWEREQDWSEDEDPVSETRRIEYVPAMSRDRSESRAPRRIEPPRSRSRRRSSRRGSEDGFGYESDRREASRMR